MDGLPPGTLPQPTQSLRRRRTTPTPPLIQKAQTTQMHVTEAPSLEDLERAPSIAVSPSTSVEVVCGLGGLACKARRAERHAKIFFVAFMAFTTCNGLAAYMTLATIAARRACP